MKTTINTGFVLMAVDESAVDRAIRMGVCNIYHGCVHNILHEKSDETLRGLYKSASFVVQAIVFKQTGKYVKQQKELQPVASSNEKVIVDTFYILKMVVRLILSKCLKLYLLGVKNKLQTTDNYTTFAYIYLNSAHFGYSYIKNP